MNETKIPGLNASHQIITPNCIGVHCGPEGAWQTAVEKLYSHYLRATTGYPEGTANFHLVLTVERLTSKATEGEADE